MKSFVAAIALLFVSAVQAGQVSVEICATGSIEYTGGITSGFSGFDEQCISLDVIAELDDEASWDHTADGRSISIPWGGCSPAEGEVGIRTVFEWRYAIDRMLTDGEQGTAWATFSLGDEIFTDNEGSGMSMTESVIPASTCIDGLVSLNAFASVSATYPGELEFSFPNPYGINGLFVDSELPNAGFDFNRHELGLTVFFYGAASDGSPMWLISEPFDGLVHPGPSYVLKMFEVDPGGSGEQEMVGTLDFNFFDCETGSATLLVNRLDEALNTDLWRIVGYHGTYCQ